VTIDDPKAHNTWVGKPIRCCRAAEIGEWYCTVEDESKFNEKNTIPTFVDKK
jgi:hypothetical protein